MMDGYLALRWNNHNIAFKNILQSLREQEIYTDVSLACERKLFHVHKFVLSMCSDTFKDIFSQFNVKQHPIVYMKDVQAKDLESILDFMYKGEINISKSELGTLLRTAESLQVKGLAVSDNGFLDEEDIIRSPKIKVESNYHSSDNIQRNSTPKFLKRSRPLESSSIENDGQRKRLKEVNSSVRNNKHEISNTINFDEISTVSSPFDIDLLQIKKELEENNLTAENGLNSDDERNRLPKEEEEFTDTYDNSNMSFDNSEISTTEYLQVDLNEERSLLEVDKTLLSNADNVGVLRKPFACSLCPNTFTRRDNLTNHVKTHLGERPYMCQYCKKCFTRKDYLKQHERIHTGEKPFRCDICDRAFTRKEGLTDHIRCHSDFKEFACDICGKEFKQKCGLRFHKRNYHLN